MSDNIPAKIYDAKQMAKISELFSDIEAAMKKFEGGEMGGLRSNENPLYIFTTEIVIRHQDDYTIGRIGMDDFLFFELTDEKYGEKP